MRSLLFFISVAALLSAGIFLFAQDSNAPLLTGNKFMDDILYGYEVISDEERNELPSEEEREEILIGQWKYSCLFRFRRGAEQFEGEIEYREDGTFTKYITYKYYEADYLIAYDSPSVVAGGVVSGTWSFNEGYNWQESCTKCTIKTTHNETRTKKAIDVCAKFSVGGDPVVYGAKIEEFRKSQVTTFTPKEILIEGTSFSTGKPFYYHFKKK